MLKNKNPARVSIAIHAIGNIGLDSLDVASKLKKILSDAKPDLQVDASEALARLGLDYEALGHAYTGVAINHFLNRELRADYDLIDEAFRPLHLNSATGTRSLPPFPWPPPRYSGKLEFGVEVPLNLIGNNQTTLQAVRVKFANALLKADPNFQQGLFGVPGGFALLTKMERIKEDGLPQPGKYRWVYGKIPPLSLSDYLGQLFFAQPGYYREIAFVFTNETNFGPGSGDLPDINSDGTDLPDDIAKKTLNMVHGYILIYSFQRVNGGDMKNYTRLGPLVHLTDSGILKSLSP